MNADRVPALDLLRFLAAFFVMLYHYTYHRGIVDLSALEAVTLHGHLGVEIFFMISGFVILWSAQGRSGRAFARARILRLYPEFWIAVAVSATVFYLVPGGFGSSINAGQIAGNLTMVPGYLGIPYIDGVYWTLAVEIKFYVLVWLLIVLRQLAHLEGCLYGWLAICVVAEFVNVGPVRTLIIAPYGPFFAAGGLLYLLFEAWTRTRAIALMVAYVLCSMAAVRGMSGFVDAPHMTPASNLATVAIIFAAFAIFVLLPRMRLVRWPAWVALVGSLTYPLYLLHNVGKELMLGRGLPEPVAVIAAMVISLTLAWVVMLTARSFVKPALKRALGALGLGQSVTA
jgi:peptidoglycan/LPS O-acetylase OafA/YrhL